MKPCDLANNKHLLSNARFSDLRQWKMLESIGLLVLWILNNDHQQISKFNNGGASKCNTSVQSHIGSTKYSDRLISAR